MPASLPLPLAPEPALQTAARLLAEGRPDQAAERLAALLADAPTYAAAHVLHATALEAAGRAADALQAWSHAAFLVPRSPLVQRERQRLATLFAPAEPDPSWTEDAPESPTWTEDAPEPAAPEPSMAERTAPETLLIGDAPAEAVDDATDDALAELNRAEDTPRLFDEPFLDGLPLESLTTFFETDTPLFVEDDDDEAPAASMDEPIGEPVAPPPVADWGDLPPVRVPLLPPDAPVSATHPEPQAPPSEPGDWRVIETVDHGAPEAPPEAPPEPEPRAKPEPVAVPADDLDALISSLEHAPRIRPDPAFSGPAVRVDESGVDEMVSETLAQIYAAQHRYVEAAVMYEKLAAREPSRADAMLQRAAELRGRR